MKMQKYAKFFYLFLVLCLCYGCDGRVLAPTPIDTAVAHRDDAQKIATAFRNHQSNLVVESKGQVVKILPDDLKGSRHQQFVLQLAQGQTILIAHNMDIAPRINQLAVGDEVYFSGEYEWNRQGGVVHWTHHDPEYRRFGGWLEHKGVRYE